MARAMMIIGVAALIVGVIIYAIIDCVRTEHERVRALPKPIWALVIVLFPLIGAVLWLVFGKHKIARSGFGPVSHPHASQAPDDDPDYLRFLEAKSKREAESRRRAEEHHGRDDDDDDEAPPEKL